MVRLQGSEKLEEVTPFLLQRRVRISSCFLRAVLLRGRRRSPPKGHSEPKNLIDVFVATDFDGFGRPFCVGDREPTVVRNTTIMSGLCQVVEATE